MKRFIMSDRYSILPHIRSAINDDGGVLLDLKRGRCLSLNPVGGQVWNALERHPKGLTVNDLVDELLPMFNGVGRDILLRDMRDFLPELESKGVISNGNDPQHFSSFSKIPLTSIEHILSESVIAGSDARTEAITHEEKELYSSRDHGILLYSILAMIALAGFDLTLKIFGFPRLYRIVKGWPTRRLISPKQPSTLRICASVDRACRYYLKQALCLQRSAVTTCLLRLAGVPAQMVIAARVMPFHGHAWVEAHGDILNDKQNVKEFYRVLERC